MTRRHYSYRVDHDLGFAPHVRRGVCTVCGCKATTVERWVTEGSWVVGIGGHGTGRPDMLLYAMRVDATASYLEFGATNPTYAAYLSGRHIALDAPVLVSRHFYYFGDRARQLPRNLVHIVHGTQGCKRIADRDIESLQKYLREHFKPGRLGLPNNRQPDPGCRSRGARYGRPRSL